MTGGDPLTDLALVFAQLSLLAFGGANTIIPEMQRQVVEVHHWFGPAEFAALFALAQAAPGPNMMVVSLIGWNVAGVPGALAYLVAGVWYRFKDAPWRAAIQRGLMPVTAGLLMASAALLLHATAIDWVTMAVIIAATGLFMFTRLHPLLVLGGAALVGALGVPG